MATGKTVKIHGKDYMPVSERVIMAHNELKEGFSISTEVLREEPNIVIKAVVTTPKGTFTGISAANPLKAIEKQNPYEVAETSAVGRALGFAGYGILEGIASADEVVKSEQSVGPAREAVTVPVIYASEPQRKMIFALGYELGHDAEETKEIVKTHYGLESLTQLTKSQASKLIEVLQKKAEAKPKVELKIGNGEPQGGSGGYPLPVSEETVNPDDIPF